MLKKNIKKRVDLTEELVFTIDSKSSRALDDALSMAEASPGVYRLSIHISDVASLIPENSPVDNEAYKRGESTYVSRHFFMPMLPTELN